MRFLIKGAECSKNKGTAAILKSSVLTLRKFFDKCVFISASPTQNLIKGIVVTSIFWMGYGQNHAFPLL